jgi:hypothetical protein
MKPALGLLLAAAIAVAPVCVSASPIVYHLNYENNGVIVAGTITTNGTLGTLTSGDIIGVHLLVSDTGLPGIILEPLGPGYTTVQINSTPVSATAQGLFYDTTNKQGYLKIGDDPYGVPEFILQYNGMMVGEGGGGYGIPLSGTFEFATSATPPPAPEPPARFHAEADAIYGTVTNTVSGRPPNIVTVGPVDEAAVNTDFNTGSSNVPAASASQSIFAVPVYSVQNIDDSAQTDYTVSADDGIAEAKTGQGSLLNGLISWQSNDNRLSCQPDATIPNRVDCSSTETITGLVISRVAIHHGKYPAGTSFPVFGGINDPSCTVPGVETFSGYLILQESQITGLGTSGVTAGLTGMHLVGDATCISGVAGHSFITHYDLAISSPSLPNYDTGSGNSAPPNTAFSVQMQ